MSEEVVDMVRAYEGGSREGRDGGGAVKLDVRVEVKDGRLSAVMAVRPSMQLVW